MRLLFVHKNYPAQFGHIAKYLAEEHGFECTFLSELPDAVVGRVRRIQYRVLGGARGTTHHCARSFENYIWHSHAVFQTLKEHPEIKPDLIVGHSGFGTTLFLPELYDCPIINYFEYYYRSKHSDMDFRPEYASPEINLLRARARNAMFLADLETCARGYCPMQYQRSVYPAHWQEKLEVIFDGIDTALWRRLSKEEIGPRRVGDLTIPDDVRVVTYVSRGFESMRGFDIFMRVTKRICVERPNVIILVVGSDRICYGGDERFTGGRSFKDFVISQDSYDLDRIRFLGQLPRDELARVLSMSDLHLYLTVPFVLSWSMMNALACGCTVLASNTPPVQEMIRDNDNGLLADFYDVDRFVELSLAVLDEPGAYRHLGAAGQWMIQEQYSMEVIMPRMLRFYSEVAHAAV